MADGPNVFEILKGVNEIGKSLVPQVFQEVDVVVYGDPNVSRRRLYNIAVAAAFGQITTPVAGPGDTLPTGMLMLEYSSEENVVRFYIRNISTWLGVLKNGINLLTSLDMFKGPKDSLTGGKWTWYGDLALIGAAAANPAALAFGEVVKNSALSNIPFTGKPILVKDRTYAPAAGKTRASINPFPAQDGVSRGDYPMGADPRINGNEGLNDYRRPDFLLYQALTDPCTTSATLRTPAYPLVETDITNPIPPTFALPPNPVVVPVVARPIDPNANPLRS